jgi:hypothetical protein
MKKVVLFTISYFFCLHYGSAQVYLEKLKINESKIIKDIQNMKSFPKNREFDHHIVIYNANIPLKYWSIESIKDSKILSKLIFEKKTLKKYICKDIESFSSQVYFVNSKLKSEYFYTDGDLFYTQFADLDTILVNYLLNEKGLIFINVLNLNSDIYFIIENNEIKKIFDRRLTKMFGLESYIKNYPDNLKPNESFNFLNNK